MIAATGAAQSSEAGAATPRTPGESLALLARGRATGALYGPLGSLHLVDGRVTAAESARAPGLAELLTGCGRTTPEEWAELLRVHGPHERVGEALVERRLLTRGELELGHLGTLFDAAFFVLADPSGGRWRFDADARHWLGPVAAVDPARLHREVERRRRLLDGIWPWGQLDNAPVRPVEHGRRPPHRPSGRRRRELLDHADGRRTPADLARLLGRSGFGVTADVRRLAAAGLLDALRPPEAPAADAPVAGAPAPEGSVPATRAPVAPPPAAGGRAPGGLHRRVPGAALRDAGLAGAGLRGGGPADAPAAAAPAAARAAAPTAAPAAAPASNPTGTGSGTAAPTHSAHPPTTAAAHPLAVPDPDIALLTRVRDLLEARL
ncbi:hypothetical protein ACIQOW_17920 [Kitasatospora sp. NPDC091335]|uniref:hypothetical protein n=1 Tax=Kitasatospora sp. NPDC091335 TaxID=3364085 RepID=UPI003829AF2B